MESNIKWVGVLSNIITYNKIDSLSQYISYHKSSKYYNTLSYVIKINKNEVDKE